MKSIYRMLIALFTGVFILAACAPTPAETAESEAEEGMGIANPASVNCEDKGGTLVMETRGDGGQYGVCVFADNRQCEEWAMFNGYCPEGGVDTAPYGTPASLFCAISGGEYAITDKAGQEDEQGTCGFQSGVTCDVWEYYNVTCEDKQ